MRPGIKRSLVALINFGLLAFPLATYTAVNDFHHPQVMLIFLAVISLIILGQSQWPKQWYLWWSLLVISLIGSSYASYPLNQALSPTWAMQFVTKLIQQTQAFRTATTSQMMPVLLSMLLIMALTIGLTMLTVRWHQPVLSILVSVGYLLAVTLFATRNEVVPLTMTIGLACLLLVVLFNQHWAWWQLGYLIIIAAVLGGSATVNTWAKGPLKQLASATLTWRNQLSSTGFYNFLAQSSAAKKTGISEDTATLGGSIQDDNSVAFKAITSSNHYWRVDTRDEYSGKGWTASDEQTTRKPTTTSSGYTTKPTTSSQSVRLNLAKTVTYLPVGYGQTTWAVSANQQQRIGVSYSAERGRIYINTGKQPLTTVQYRYQPQQYTAAQLTAITAKTSTDITDTYTQLPDELPNRIKRLSQKLTKGQTTQYGRVHALVHYLKSTNKFEYTKIDTPTTPSKRDYVDYFLFTSKRGYCDNFSTSLVVMLRTLGIPARWADGFSGGTRGKSAGNGQYHYQILNSDAHSWAEVYFAGIGWVPFDPTPGYQNPGTKKAKQVAAKKAASSTRQASSTTTSQSRASQSSSTTKASQQTATSQASHTTKRTTTRFKLNTTSERLIIGSVILSLMLLAWLTRRWLLLLGITASLQLTRWPVTRSYRLLCWWFERQHARRPAESLTAYADTIEQLWPQLDGQFKAATDLYLAQSFGHQATPALRSTLRQAVAHLRHHHQPIKL
ncbi:transglutaminase TgpA family protein [Lactiplantibacillus daowaiensis]|uniref:DUF3488 and DUF4129 domain-containing transglutaminase family protein n=1 Tax=Lactiplantibacillus daowaiensis TaxID=2559918 RepID=A0ABW1S492_9LACO|nr:transglutaminase domain-containing protein [Lactiplantibacillus daowaiensis]